MSRGGLAEGSRSTRLAFTLSILLSCLLIAINRDAARETGPMASNLTDMQAPVLSVLSKPIRSVESYFENVRDRSRAVEENRALRAELAELRNEEARLRVLQLKVRRYEDIYGVLKRRDELGERIAARVVSELDSPFRQSLLIDIGLNRGLVTGQAVMDGEGLVGHIVQVGDTSSRVLKLDDLSSRIPVMSARTGGRAMLIGTDKGAPYLEYLVDPSEWAAGDLVLTSGDDNLLPQGLRAGFAKLDGEGSMRVDLLTSANRLDMIWVHPKTQIPKPETSDPRGGVQ